MCISSCGVFAGRQDLFELGSNTDHNWSPPRSSISWQEPLQASRASCPTHAFFWGLSLIWSLVWLHAFVLFFYCCLTVQAMPRKSSASFYGECLQDVVVICRNVIMWCMNLSHLWYLKLLFSTFPDRAMSIGCACRLGPFALPALPLCCFYRELESESRD